MWMGMTWLKSSDPYHIAAQQSKGAFAFWHICQPSTNQGISFGSPNSLSVNLSHAFHAGMVNQFKCNTLLGKWKCRGAPTDPPHNSAFDSRYSKRVISGNDAR